ncbi:RGCVC family protein [Modestobacter sp. SSW1-42]|uniref:RGCVC family protein n=1 Tax=Modestobacter sp. SSW1-42 TaxID=596372 RepID=UPI00398846FF
MTVSPFATDAPSPEDTAPAPHAGVPEAPGCPACAHPMSAHDRIGVRFCLATTAGGTDRGCVCSAA